MTDEIQILSDISLKYVIAIGYGNNKMNNSSTDYSFQLTNEWQSNLETIQKLLKKYNFQIPIINPVDGSVYENNKKLILK